MSTYIPNFIIKLGQYILVIALYLALGIGGLALAVLPILVALRIAGLWQ